ncbi:MAG TPA: sulfite exporter TauE/SafE family protein [Chloroflexota bacterium]|nr:sulfite exporter TauE/SafE family protein [Chloroflexota bacterium]
MPGWEFAAILVAGLAIGLLGAMAGIGGGTLMVPFLTVALHLPIHTAIAASIVAVIATSCAAAAVYLSSRITNVRLGITLETATTFGGIVGGLTAISLGRDILTIVFAVSLLGTAVAMGRRQEVARSMSPETGEGELGGHFYDPSLRREVHYRTHRLPLGLSLSVFAGFLSGLLGIGGGVVKVPAMVLGMGTPVKAATATSNFMIGVTAVASAYIYYAHGYVDAPVTSAVAIGVFFGSVAGARWAPHLHSDVLSRGFAVILAGVAVLMILRALGVV